MASFRGRARIGTWLTRVAINSNRALMRLRRRRRDRIVVPFHDPGDDTGPLVGADVPDEASEPPTTAALRDTAAAGTPDRRAARGVFVAHPEHERHLQTAIDR